MEDNTEKIKAFLDEYHMLVEKHHIDFASYPMFVPGDAGMFNIVIRNTPVPVPQKAEDPEGIKSPLVM